MTSTATTAVDLVRDAEDALIAARAAHTFLTLYPGLPVTRMHADGGHHDGKAGPRLEIQLDGDTDALARFATRHGLTVAQDPEVLGIVEYRTRLTVHDVEVTITAWTGDTSEPF